MLMISQNLPPQRKNNTDSISRDILDSSPIRVFQAKDYRIAYRDMGFGYPLVLLMGLGGTMSEWDRIFLEILASQYRLIIFDYRGIGFSGNESTWSFPTLVSDTHELIRSLGIVKADIFGYSFGSMIALDLYATHPDCVSSLILYGIAMSGKEIVYRISPYIDRESPEILNFHALFPDEWISSHPDMTKVFPRPAHQVNGPVIFSQIDIIREWQTNPEILSVIAIPVLILAGSADVITPLVSAKKVADSIPGSTIIVYIGGGHGVMYQKPDRMARHILEYKNRNRRE